MQKYVFEQFLLPAANYNLSRSGIHRLSLVQLQFIRAYLFSFVVTWKDLVQIASVASCRNFLMILKESCSNLFVSKTLLHRLQIFTQLSVVKGRYFLYIYILIHLCWHLKKNGDLMGDLACLSLLQIINSTQKIKQSNGVVRGN